MQHSERKLELYRDIKSRNIDYILMHQISQDHLEMFFSKIRSRVGADNNPTAFELIHIYKKLLF